MNEDFYSSFQERYRGSRDLIKFRLGIYLDFINPLKDVYSNPSAIDLGCGRGEWLELIEENGFEVQGVDLSNTMMRGVSNPKIKIHNKDAISFLKSLPSASHEVVSSFHMIEHIEFESLEILVAESLRVLKPGGILILETPNPENIIVGSSNFYLDPSHKSPIHPETLSFLTKYTGFELVKIVRINESNELVKQKQFELRDLLYGVSPDYSIVAQKHYDPNKFKLEIEAFNLNYGFRLEDLLVQIENTNREKDLLIDTKLASLDTKLASLDTKLASLDTKFESFSIFLKPFSVAVKKALSFLRN